MELTKAATGAEADERLALTRRIMAVAGHDLKQPLQIAMIALDRIAGAGVGLYENGQLTIAQAALRRLNVELEDLARSSQAADRLTPMITPVALGAVIAEVGGDWGIFADACGVALSFEASEHHVLTDAAMLKTILRNLIGNALKYSSRGGAVSVSAARRDGLVVVEVRDAGCGIAQNRLPLIFDAFNRGGRSDVGGGLGLGLHIVRQTAELLGHSVAVRSVEGEGSIFSVALTEARPVGERSSASDRP